uniref:Calcineurin-like phosphoesterase domain-containing protein n=1 Tax=Anopheles dirus TaxID=7168 RepID=A0A182NPW2_9DIPT
MPLFWKIYLPTLAGLILYNEYLIHIYHSFQWAELECETDSCVKILFVADPQILGNTFDRKLYWPLANLDSDRYVYQGFRHMHLKRTYKRVVQHTTPDVICFLGDLMDEGSVASDVQFADYFTRFVNIFSQPTASTLMFYIPGDNDIGGEGLETIKSDRVLRFKQYFNEQDELTVESMVRFVNVNRISMTIPPTTAPSIPEQPLQAYTVLLSHLPILRWTDPFTYKVIDDLQPNVIFSAHEHKSLHVKTHRNRLSQGVTYVPLNTKRETRHEVLEFNLDYLKDTRELLEFVVPTCSYRMGEMKIGYGYAMFDGDKLRYTVLWTSQRFYQLAAYSMLLIPLKLVCGQIWCGVLKRYWCCCRKRNRTYLPLPLA